MPLYKKILILATTLISISAPVFVYAQYGIEETQKATGNLLPKTVAGAGTVPQLVGKIVAVALSLLGIIFFLMILYAGGLWMIAMGNQDRVTRAKEIMEAAVIGLLIVLASYAISRFIFERLAGGGSSVSPGGEIVQGQCNPQKQQQGDICDLNSICVLELNKNLICKSECEAVELGTCGPKANCKTSVVLNKCPGGTDNVCCKL